MSAASPDSAPVTPVEEVEVDAPTEEMLAAHNAIVELLVSPRSYRAPEDVGDFEAGAA